MIRELTIKNYKSILDHTIELGRINVFIGENGCGKTNILEAAAMGAAALTNKLEVEELWNRGMRVAKPSIMRSSFKGAASGEIAIGFGYRDAVDRKVEIRLVGDETSRSRTRWTEVGSPADKAIWDKLVAVAEREAATEREKADLGALAVQLADRLKLETILGAYAVYNPNILALRALQTVSRREPLGVHGENLHNAIAALDPATWADVLERAKCVSWVEDIVIDPADHLKYEGHKLLQSDSTLYFYDKFIDPKNNVFSAENVNEGILHVLFYLTLFVSKETPSVFGIDNIETALNPQLCRELIEQLADLAAKHGKQALITTHNPAILDGLNLHDDEQRLFVVSRNDAGHTVTDRIKLKPKVDDAKFKYKLSELWMRGHLGGLPEKF